MSMVNNRFFQVMEKVADMAIISALWVALSLPVITFVPACIALYYASVKVVRRQAGYAFRDFFRGFGQNWKQGVILELFYGAAALLLFLAWEYSQAAGVSTLLGKFFFLFFLIGLFVLACVSLYLIPVVSRFQTTLLSAFRLAVSFAFGNLLTLVPLIFTLVGAIVVCYLFPPAIFVIPSAYCFLLSYSVEKVLADYMRKNMENPEQYENMWYMQ